MERLTTPVIKGIFVKSHINALKKEKGEIGLKELKRRYHKPLDFKNSDTIPVREEIKIIEHVYDILNENHSDNKNRTFEAGRLHFRNFTTTAFARIIFPLLRKKFKAIMLNSGSIASHVFQGIKFTSEEVSEKEIKIFMQNTDYPIEHFSGLFYEWMQYSGLSEVSVQEKILEKNFYEYILKWK